MKKPHGVIRQFTIVLMGLLLFVSIGYGKPTLPQTRLRLGYFPNLTHAAAMIGIDRGFFQSAVGSRVTIETHIFNAGPELMEAMAAGEIDLAYIGPGPALTGFVRGVPLQIISGANNAGAVLVASPKSQIKSPKDLTGKKVAVPQLGNTQDISLRHLLAENGLKDKAKGGNVEIFQVAPADVLTLFTQGQMDAALVPEPWGTILEHQGGARLVLDWDRIWKEGDYPTTVVIAKNDFVKKHSGVVRAFLTAHRRSVKYLINNPQESCQAINRQLKALTKKEIPVDVLEKAYKRIKPTLTVNPKVLQEYADLSVEAGYIKGRIDVRKVINFNDMNDKN